MTDLDNINSKLYVTLEINKMFDNRIFELIKLNSKTSQTRIDEINIIRKSINLILEEELT